MSPQRSPKHNQSQPVSDTASVKDKKTDPTGEGPGRPGTLSMGAAKPQSEAISVPSSVKSSPECQSVEMKQKADSQDVRMVSSFDAGIIYFERVTLTLRWTC